MLREEVSSSFSNGVAGWEFCLGPDDCADGSSLGSGLWRPRKPRRVV